MTSDGHERCHRSLAAVAFRASVDDDDDAGGGWYGKCNAVSLLLPGDRNAVDSRPFSLLTDSHSDLHTRQTPLTMIKNCTVKTTKKVAHDCRA